MGFGLCSKCCANTTVTGTLLGCNATGAPGTVQIKNGATVLWSGATDGTGKYTAVFGLSGTVGLTIVGTPTSSRMVAGSGTISVVGGGTNTGKNVTVTADTPYVCHTGCSPYPISRVLTLDGITNCGSFPGPFPNDTLTYQTTAPGTTLGLVSPGWLGAATFSLGGHTCNYWFQAQGSGGPWAIRAFNVAAGFNFAFCVSPPTHVCPTLSANFSVGYDCTASAIIGTVHE